MAGFVSICRGFLLFFIFFFFSLFSSYSSSSCPSIFGFRRFIDLSTEDVSLFFCPSLDIMLHKTQKIKETQKTNPVLNILS